MNSKNITSWLNRRETDSLITRRFERQMHVVPSFTERFGLTSELEGHTGCVNCLEWNSTGQLLASGSDDLNAIVWEPLCKRKLCTISTGHTGNIFSVKFLPCTNDEIVATAAADAKVRIHSVEKAENTSAFHCHIGRVKRLAVAPNSPDMLWSASEDGTIRQFDLRQAHSCNSSSNKNCKNVLINLNVHVGAMAEAKCIAINPVRPELMAVGCNDPFVRVYDHRMLSTQNSSLEQKATNGGSTSLEEARLPVGCVKYFAPGHLPPRLSKDFPRPLRAYVATYVNFSPDGNEVIVNLGGEQIYLFDIRKPVSVVGYRQFNGLSDSITSNGVVKDVIDCMSSATCDNNSNVANGTTNGFKILPVNGKTLLLSKPTNGHKVLNSSSLRKDLPPKALELKALGNEAFCKQQFWTAVNAYNEAISLAPNSAILYANRAAAYIKRAWDGDIYAALRDCHIALGLDPHNTKAHFRKARCLYELRWCQEAQYCLNQFKTKFPEQADGTAAKTLEREIKAAAFAETEEPNENGSSDKNTRTEGGSSRRRQRRMSVISDQERVFRSYCYDYSRRFCGHCNTTTDIKEANFFGSNGQYVVAGSDDGSFFLWDKETTNLLRVLKGDDSIVNCLQPHPSICLLATSGIDPVIRLWGPRPLDGKAEGRQVEEVEAAARANQKRMNADPLEVMLMNMGYRTRFSTVDDDENDDNPVQCRTA